MRQNKANLLSIAMTSIFLLLSSTAHSENKTFEKVCKSCHTGGFKGFMSGAPNIKDKKAWQEYLAKHSYDEMRSIVLLGTDEHKTKGGCKKKCSDEEIIGAIDYMLRQVDEKGNK